MAAEPEAYDAHVIPRCGVLLAITASCLGVSGCGTSRSQPPVQRIHVAARPAYVPDELVAHRLHNFYDRFVRRGMVVRQANDVGPGRVFDNQNHGFALAAVRNEIYPATTHDGGRTWRVNGPLLVGDGADASTIVTDVGVASANTYFAYGGARSVIDLTSDAGKQWWQVAQDGSILAVLAEPKRRLAAVVQFQQHPNGPLVGSAFNAVYVSTDQGRHWRYTSQTVP